MICRYLDYAFGVLQVYDPSDSMGKVQDRMRYLSHLTVVKEVINIYAGYEVRSVTSVAFVVVSAQG